MMPGHQSRPDSVAVDAAPSPAANGEAGPLSESPTDPAAEPNAAAPGRRVGGRGKWLIGVYLGLFAAAFAMIARQAFGLLPVLLLIAASWGVMHLAYRWVLADDDDYLEDLQLERGGRRRKKVVFFVDNG